jgi:hypothetical protein
MKTKNFFILIALALLLQQKNATAQDLDDFYANRAYNFYLVNTNVSRHTSGVSTPLPAIFAPFFGANKFRSRQWARTFEYTNSFGSDVIASLYNKFLIHPGEKQNFWLGNALFGNYNWGINFYGGKHTIVCAGINLSDQNLYNSDAVGAGYKAWHLCGGGFIRIDQVIAPMFAVRLRAQIARSWLTAQSYGPNQIHPLFIALGPELFTKQGFYLSADYSRDITRLSTHVQRLDIKIGARVRIKRK